MPGERSSLTAPALARVGVVDLINGKLATTPQYGSGFESPFREKEKYTANVKLDSAHRYVEIDMIFETARFELVFGSSASQDDHFSPLRHTKGINRRRLMEALAEGNDERQHSQGGRHHIQFTTTQTASPPMTSPGAADNHI